MFTDVHLHLQQYITARSIFLCSLGVDEQCRATIDVSMYCKLLIMEYAFVYLKCNHISQIKNIQTDKRVFTVK